MEFPLFLLYNLVVIAFEHNAELLTGKIASQHQVSDLIALQQFVLNCPFHGIL